MGTKMRSIVSVAAILLAGFAIVLTIGLKTNGGPSEAAHAESANGGQWEYLIVQGGNVNLVSGNVSERKAPDGSFNEAQVLQRNFDKLGAKGWELVTVFGGTQQQPIYYFKRLKEAK